LGGTLAFNFAAIDNPLVLMGSIIIAVNGALFGWISLWHQRRINIAFLGDRADEYQKEFQLVLRAYKDCLDNQTQEHGRMYLTVRDEFFKWRGQQNKNARRTPLNIGVGYWILLCIGILALWTGMILEQNQIELNEYHASLALGVIALILGIVGITKE